MFKRKTPLQIRKEQEAREEAKREAEELKWMLRKILSYKVTFARLQAIVLSAVVTLKIILDYVLATMEAM